MRLSNLLLMTALFCATASAEQKNTPAEDSWKTKVFSAEELKKCDGKDGRPAYVAVDGVVYDVSGVKEWKGGKHMHLHNAGSDLTSAIHGRIATFAHKGRNMVENLPKVGVMAGKGAVATSAAPAAEKTPAAPAAAAPQEAKKTSLLAVHKVSKAEVGSSATCPVSGAKIKVAENTPALDLKGKTYYFSSSDCMDKFGKEPAKYLQEKAKGLLKKKN